MRTINSEFPDYDNVALNIPPFTCEPWKNDACPRYVWRGLEPDLPMYELTLWLDYKDSAKRDNYGATMYYFTVGIEGDGRPLLEFWGESEDELRDTLNGWYEERVGYRPDADVTPKLVDLGELMLLVGQVGIRHMLGR